MTTVVERLGCVSSTQDCARILAKRNAPEGVVLTAAIQDFGRGRLGRKWISPEGGLWFTMILRPEFRPSDASEITLMAAGSVASVITEMTGLEPDIKEPNDILIGGAKVCGILADMAVEGDRIKYILLGVGVNANACPDALPDDKAYAATSLKAETARPVDLDELLANCVRAIMRDYVKLT